MKTSFIKTIQSFTPTSVYLLLSFFTGVAQSFDASSNENVAVYWGQNSGGNQLNLGSYCQSSDADIFILSFMSAFPGSDGIPVINFSDACFDTFSDGLLQCSQIASDIQSCQNNGKKVLLSLGGASGSYGFSSDSEGETFATTLWNMFGGGTNSERPFGSSVVDGFDFDFENNVQTGNVAFAKKLKELYETDTSKTYYLSAAPQCPYPDQSVGDVLSEVEVDFAFVQFYNNYCSLSSSSFNWDTWSSFAKTAPNPNIKIFVGLPASSAAAGSGFVDADVVKSTIDSIGTDTSLGGIMLWDASIAFSNTDSAGDSFVAQMKNILEGNGGSSSGSSSGSSGRNVVPGDLASSSETTTQATFATTSSSSSSTSSTSIILENTSSLESSVETTPDTYVTTSDFNTQATSSSLTFSITPAKIMSVESTSSSTGLLESTLIPVSDVESNVYTVSTIPTEVPSISQSSSFETNTNNYDYETTSVGKLSSSSPLLPVSTLTESYPVASATNSVSDSIQISFSTLVTSAPGALTTSTYLTLVDSPIVSTLTSTDASSTNDQGLSLSSATTYKSTTHSSITITLQTTLSTVLKNTAIDQNSPSSLTTTLTTSNSFIASQSTGSIINTEILTDKSIAALFSTSTTTQSVTIVTESSTYTTAVTLTTLKAAINPVSSSVTAAISGTETVKATETTQETSSDSIKSANPSSSTASSSSSIPATSNTETATFEDCSSFTGLEEAECMNENFSNGFYLGTSDSCTTDGQLACSGDGRFAMCNYGKWVLFDCPETTTCYAYNDNDSVFVGCNYASDLSAYEY